MNFSQVRAYLLILRFYLMVLLVGVVAGVGAIFFRELIAFFHNLLFYLKFSNSYDVLRHSNPSIFGIGVILVPVLGALGVAYLVQKFAPEARGHGVPEVMDAIYYEQGKVRPVVALIKAVASSLSIGSGGSVGREGPIIQIGAAFGSTIGQSVRILTWQRITLIACGAGGGIAATFNTPLGGILFALEIMLPELSARTIIPVSIATAIATYTSYTYFGNVTFLPFTTNLAIHFNTASVISYLLLSVCLGLASWLFIRLIYWLEDFFDNLPGNYYTRHVLGMFLMGSMMYGMMFFFGHYYIQGVGYATIVDVLSTTLTYAAFLFLLAFTKMIVTALTLGSGGSGGIFSPLLFIGSTFGAGFAGCYNFIFPDAQMNLPLSALAGMAGMVGASTGAPITAIIMTSELTNDSSIVLPLMILVAIAYMVRRALLKDTIYTLKLTRRGHYIPDRLIAEKNVMQ